MKGYFSKKAEAFSRGGRWNVSAPLLLKTFMTASLSLDQHHPHISTRYPSNFKTFHTGALGPFPQLHHLTRPSFLWKRNVTHWCVKTSSRRIHLYSSFFGRPELPTYESGRRRCGDRPLLEDNGTKCLNKILLLEKEKLSDLQNMRKELRGGGFFYHALREKNTCREKKYIYFYIYYIYIYQNIYGETILRNWL